MTADNHLPPFFGRYRVLSKLGSGAMGEVLLARDTLLDRDVALKTLTADCLPDPGGRRPAEERFLLEARAVASIDHPNVVRLFDAGRANGIPYLVMEAVRGPSLAARLDEGLLSPPAVRALGIQLARALEAAHARGIVHRDVKPTNVLESGPGAWKLADFGIARLPYSTLTFTGHFVGTPAYAAPESLLRGTFTTASDIYGLGATLYEALCGTPPHGLAGGRTMVGRVNTAVTPPRQILGHVPAELETAVLAALRPDPAQRPTAAQLIDLLAATRASRPIPRRKMIAASVAAGVALLALLAAGASGEPTPATASPAPPVILTALPTATADPEVWFPPDPVDAAAADGADAVQPLIARGSADDAIARLRSCMGERPDDARCAYLLGNLYFDRQWWTQGFAAYRAALSADPSLRHDATLIRNAIKALMSPSQAARAARFLTDDIGDPAVPHLQQALSSPSLTTRRAAARLLRKLDARQPAALW